MSNYLSQYIACSKGNQKGKKKKKREKVFSPKFRFISTNHAIKLSEIDSLMQKGIRNLVLNIFKIYKYPCSTFSVHQIR